MNSLFDNTVIACERRGYSCGTLSRVTLGDTTIIWRLDGQNGRGLPVALSNSALETALDYDVDNRVIDRYVTLKADPNIEVNSQLYNYNGATGNMAGRGVYDEDEEVFTYDALQRLTGYGGKTITYDLIGNIVQKSDIGALEYDGTPYAFTFLTDTAMVMPSTTQAIAYNALQLPDTINEGGYRATFMYYGDGTRSRMTLGYNNGLTQVCYYDGQFNRYHRYEGNVEYTKDILWLGGTPYTAPAALMRVSDGPVPGGDNWRLYYVVRDNQGSIVAVTDSAGNTLQALRYDPWGNIVDNSDGHLLTRGEQPELLLERGYTGHEHLPQFGLINMNARLYEPLTARFLSPDPEVQAPDFSQNLNRYSYCLNNPLRYIDPTGMVACSAADTVGMTGEQKEEYLKYIAFVQENEILSEWYNKLNGDLSFNVPFAFGETSSEYTAYYDPINRTIIYSLDAFNNSLEIGYLQLTEEFFHMLQDYCGILNSYAELGINVELEAKLLSALSIHTYGNFKYVRYFFDELPLMNLFESAFFDLHPSFTIDDYRIAGSQFVEHYKALKMNDPSYLSPVKTASSFFQKYISIKF